MKDLSPERWRQIETLLDGALDREPDERAAYLDEACGDDPILRHEVQALLDAEKEAPGFLDEPALALAESLFSDLEAEEETEPNSDTNYRGQSDPYKLSGQTIGHYAVQHVLGRGGMGVVYRAEDTRLHRPVALKLLPPTLSDDVRANERFLVEAQAASALDHPNICTIYEFGETEAGQFFIAMPYYAGESLRQKIDDGPLGAEESLDYAIQIARGLAAAHGAGIVGTLSPPTWSLPKTA